ncbi:MAG: RNA methyltransferase [Defluviitaleaceae bacterium]|nr:RNA methyltransferase [Defluviitaleaceae bacterium]
MEIITSRNNPIVRLAKSLKDKKFRRQHGLFVVEGEKFVAEIPAGWEIAQMVASQSYAQSLDLRDCAVVADNLFGEMADTVNSQGIFAIVKIRQYSFDDICNTGNSLIIILDGINDPGNLGAILRLADSAGASGVFLGADCVDTYNSKVVRAAAGALFRVPFVYEDLAAVINRLQSAEIKVLAAMPKNAVSIYYQNLTEPLALLLGNEARGIKPEIARLADANVQIPMPGAAESLNAAMACGILVYEALRQRLWN